MPRKDTASADDSALSLVGSQIATPQSSSRRPSSAERRANYNSTGARQKTNTVRCNSHLRFYCASLFCYKAYLIVKRKIENLIMLIRAPRLAEFHPHQALADGLIPAVVMHRLGLLGKFPIEVKLQKGG